MDKDVYDKYVHSDAQVITAPKEKDETDGVLAVDYALKHGYTNIEILGSTGGRLDHQLGNIMLLKRILDAGCTGKLLFTNGSGVLCNEPVEVDCKVGNTISVMLFCGDVQIAKSTGLFYPIDIDTKFTYDYPIGISNVATCNKVTLDIVSGYALVFVYDLEK